MPLSARRLPPRAQTEKEQEDGTKAKVTEPHSASYPTWGEAMTCSTAGMNLRRVPPLYFLLRGAPRPAALCMPSRRAF